MDHEAKMTLCQRDIPNSSLLIQSKKAKKEYNGHGGDEQGRVAEVNHKPGFVLHET